jgi:hypothetical protein
MLFHPMSGGDHRSVALNDLGTLIGTVCSNANLQQHFGAASIIDFVFALDRLPKDTASFGQGGGRAGEVVFISSTSVSVGFLRIYKNPPRECFYPILLQLD